MKFALSTVCFFTLLLRPALGFSTSLEEFQEKMRKHVASLSGKTTAAVHMTVLGKGDVLFSHNENKLLLPASNAKLITAMAALEKLGPGFTFTTRVLLQGNDLILAGNGDPYLVSERLWLLARDVARSGITKVNSIKVSDAAFSETYQGLREFEGSGEPFTALVSATALNFNSLEIHVIPVPGKRARVETGPVPSSFVELENEVIQTGGRGKSLNVKPLGLKGDREHFLVGGSIGRNASPAVVYGTVASPELHIASVFAALLRKEGVKVTKDFGGLSSPSGKEVASLESPPLQDLVRLFNNYSNNFMAEQVFQALSAGEASAASLTKSKQVVKDFLQRHSACKESVMANGSGLSWDTRVSARCFTETIGNVYGEFRIFADLLGSLPAGAQTGTLKSRFKRKGGDLEPLTVRGKTGTLWSKQVVTSLTGLTSTASGEKVIFSLIENDERTDPGLLHGLKDWEDKCVELLQQLRI